MLDEGIYFDGMTFQQTIICMGQWVYLDDTQQLKGRLVGHNPEANLWLVRISSDDSDDSPRYMVTRQFFDAETWSGA